MRELTNQMAKYCTRTIIDQLHFWEPCCGFPENCSGFPKLWEMLQFLEICDNHVPAPTTVFFVPRELAVQYSLSQREGRQAMTPIKRLWQIKFWTCPTKF